MWNYGGTVPAQHTTCSLGLLLPKLNLSMNRGSGAHVKWGSRPLWKKHTSWAVSKFEFAILLKTFKCRTVPVILPFLSLSHLNVQKDIEKAKNWSKVLWTDTTVKFCEREGRYFTSSKCKQFVWNFSLKTDFPLCFYSCLTSQSLEYISQHFTGVW